MEPKSSGALLAITSPSRPGAGLGRDMSEDPKKEGPAEPYGHPPTTMPERDSGDHSFKALAKAFGIPAERHGSAQAALKQYIKSCLAESESSESEGEF